MSQDILALLRAVAPFSDLSEDEMAALVGSCSVVELTAGNRLFEKGDPGDRAYVVLDGELEITVPGPHQPLVLGVVGAGDLVGEAALIRGSTRNATATARSDVVLLAVEARDLLSAVGPGPRGLLQMVLDRWDSTREQVMQAERLVQLGTLAAGVAHELNNPAAAVRRGAEALGEVIGRVAIAAGEIAGHDLQREAVEALRRALAVEAAKPAGDALERAELESELTGILEQAGVPEAWRVAYEAVDSGIDAGVISQLIASVPGEAGAVAVRLVTTLATARRIAGEIAWASGHMSEIASGLSTYSRLGEAPVQEVDVVAGLRQVMALLSHKLDGIRLVEEYAENLPPVPGAGGELNQVWTNLIANAADATGPGGTITVRAFGRDDGVTVEVEDDGGGIEPEHMRRIFDAFYTTKAPGKGTGLGLSISHRIITAGHGGKLEVESRPGRTVFRTWLPIDG